MGWGEDGVVEGMGDEREGCEGMWREGKGGEGEADLEMM